jgi:hypothetical protein
MKLHFLLTGLVLLFLASFLMVYSRAPQVVGLEGFEDAAALTTKIATKEAQLAQMKVEEPSTDNSALVMEINDLKIQLAKMEGAPSSNPVATMGGFTSYFLEEAGGSGPAYQPIGAFDGVKLVPSNGQSQYRNTLPNEPLMGPAFKVGDDNLFMFKNNQCKPECCGASYACDGGCVCSTPEQRKMINMRGGNRTVEDGF